MNVRVTAFYTYNVLAHCKAQNSQCKRFASAKWVSDMGYNGLDPSLKLFSYLQQRNFIYTIKIIYLTSQTYHSNKNNKRAIPRFKHHLLIASRSRCPSKKLKSKISANSNFVLASCAQSCNLQMPH